LPGAARNCDDNNSCTNDSCDSATGCVHAANSNSCDDGNACTNNDVCSGGACKGTSAPISCDDGNACTIDTCDPEKGCIHTAVANGTSCNDGNACNGPDACNAGTCQHGPPLTCDDGNACNGVETCNPASGCVAGTPPVCNDGNACNGVETCNPASGCVAGTPPVCNDGNACNGVETCNPSSGCVAGTPLNCDNGNACDGVETCNPSSGCVAGTPLHCDDGNACNGVETCNPSSGCVAGTPLHCDDGNACNGAETCNPSSGCVAGTPLTCDDGNACNGVETCNPSSGCVAGTPLHCDDGDACNGTETCNPSSGCVAGTPVVCTAQDQCHVAGTCSGGVCSNPTKPDGTTCDDGDPVTTNDVCTNGVCAGSSCSEKPTPKTSGYYKKLCKGGQSHPYHHDFLTDQDAQCVGSLTCTFQGISTVADICAVLEDDHSDPKECAKGEQELMALALNICRNYVCLSQEVDSQCDQQHGGVDTLTTVGQSFHTADSELCDSARTNDTCKDAKCLAKEINNGHGIHHTSLHIDKASANSVRLTWANPVMDDGTGEGIGYTVWRRPMNSPDGFTLVTTTNQNTLTWVDTSPGNWEYEVTFTVQP
jgi:hypothetical protein